MGGRGDSSADGRGLADQPGTQIGGLVEGGSWGGGRGGQPAQLRGRGWADVYGWKQLVLQDGCF